MTVASSTARAIYTGDGTTVNFTVPFYFLAGNHLNVVKQLIDGTEEQQFPNTDYIVTGAGVPAGGTLVMTVAPANGEKLVILRNVPMTQTTDYATGGVFPASSHETALDKLTMQMQQIKERNDRGLVLRPTDTGISPTLPAPVAGRPIGWNGAGDALVNIVFPLSPEGPDVANQFLGAKKNFGAVGNGTTDDTAALQAMIDYSGQQLVPVYPEPGAYRITAPLQLADNCDIRCAARVRFVKDFSTTGTTGAVQNPDMAVKVNHCRWDGGTFYTPGISTEDYVGNIFCVNGDDCIFTNITIHTWRGGRAALLFGNRMRLSGWKTYNPHASGGTGGIRYAGGQDFRCSDCDITSGDDALQFVPGAAGTVLGDQSIVRGQYVNCIAYSTTARAFLCGLVDPVGTVTMTAAITDCAFIGIQGRGGTQRAAVFQNDDSTGQIGRIQVIGCHLDGTDDTTQGQSVLIQCDAGTGGVNDLWFDGLTILNPRRECVQIDGDGEPNRIHFSNFYFDRARDTGGHFVVDAKKMKNCSFRNGLVRCKESDGIIFGAGGSSGDRVRSAVIENVTFVDIPDGFGGIHINEGRNVTVRGCRFVEASGATTARAVRLNDGAFNCLVEWNDVSDIGSTAKFVFKAGQGNVIKDHIAEQEGPLTVASATSIDWTDQGRIAGSGLHVWRITGTTQIDTIGAPVNNSAVVLVLVFTAATPVGDAAGNINLSASWTGSDRDTLTLVYNHAATQWLEVARSAN